VNPLAEELNWTDEEMLYSLGAIQLFDGRIQVTMTGILVFGKASALRRLYPAHRVDYIRVPGKVWVQNPDVGFNSIDMRGPIVLTIGRILASVTDDLPKTLVIEDGMSGQRTETSVVPFRVLREAVVNALMHRSYETYQPIQIVRYSNRIEIKNPGYSLKSQERFDEPGSFIRNPTIAAILHETRYAETKGSGIRVMQEKMKQNGLAAPTFESDRADGEFRASFLFHHFLDENDWNWLAKFSSLDLTEDQMRALIFVREVGAIDNSTYRNLTQLDTLLASKSLRALVQMGLLQDRGSGTKTHYVGGGEFERLSALVEVPNGIHDSDRAIHDTIHDTSTSLDDLPERLKILVVASHTAQRLDPKAAKTIIISLCAWKPMSLNDISTLIRRTPNYVSQSYLNPLITDGKLTYLYPEMIRHPNQKYQAVPRR
jgi:ATP-dependent DNA helicase RecG